MANMRLRDLMTICEEYNGLGWAVIEQLQDLEAGNEDPDSYNFNALDMIESWLTDYAYGAVGGDVDRVLTLIEEIRGEE